jgi:hypothetical protein
MKRKLFVSPLGLIINALLITITFTSCTKKATELSQERDSEEVTSKANAKPSTIQEVSLRITVRDAVGDKIVSDGGGDYVNGFQNIQAIFSSSGYFQFNSQNSPNPHAGLIRWLNFDFNDPIQILTNPPSTTNSIGTFMSSGTSSLLGTYIPPQNLVVGQSECIVLTAAVTANGINSYQVNFHRGVEDIPGSPTAYMVITRASTTTWIMTPVGSCSPNSNVAALRDASAGITYGYYNMPFSFTLTKL